MASRARAPLWSRRRDHPAQLLHSSESAAGLSFGDAQPLTYPQRRAGDGREVLRVHHAIAVCEDMPDGPRVKQDHPVGSQAGSGIRETMTDEEVGEVIEALEHPSLPLQCLVGSRHGRSEDMLGEDLHNTDEVLDRVDVGSVKYALLTQNCLRIHRQACEGVESNPLGVQGVDCGYERR